MTIENSCDVHKLEAKMPEQIALFTGEEWKELPIGHTPFNMRNGDRLTITFAATGKIWDATGFSSAEIPEYAIFAEADYEFFNEYEDDY